MKKISAWAKAHRWPARILVFLLHFVLIAAAVYIGKNLFALSISINPAYYWFAILLYIVAVFVYPRKHGSDSPRWISRYAFQKCCDFTLTLTGLVMICFLVNRPANEASSLNPLRGAYPGHYTEPPPSTYKSSIEKKNSVKSILSKRERRAMLKALRTELREVFKAQPGRGGKIALTILVGLGAVILLLLVGSLSCELSCSGNEGAAVLVLILGTAAVVALVLFFVKKINAKYRRPVSDRRTEPR